MASVGGSIKEVTVDGRPFAVSSDGDVKVKLGGTKVTVAANGNGTARALGEVEPWSLSDIEVAIDNNKADGEFLQANADAMAFVSCTIEYIDGTVYNGSGLVSGDHDYSTAKATTGLTLMGEGKLTPQ